MSENSLTGPIPPELGGLVGLETLDLDFNSLTGPVPRFLSGLAELRRVFLQANQLTGPIPPELGDLRSLEFLALSSNDLTGPIPPVLGGLANLNFLWLGDNDLTGSIPAELGDLTSLRDLSLSGNRLTGPIPPVLGGLANLRGLGLDRNNLTGPIPPELGSLAQLQDLALSDNDLTGSLPLSFVGLTKLESVGCRGTLGVCVPATDEFRDWARGVRARGNDNSLDVAFCDEIDADALQSLYDATNGDAWTRSDGWLEDENLGRWHGVRTDSIGRVAGLDLRGNGLSGHLPDGMGLLASLTELRIGDNALSGRMPLSLAGLPLEEFDYTGTSLCVANDAGFRDWLTGIPRHMGTAVRCPPLTEREALEWVYRRTGGPGWGERTGWLTDAPLADWYGVNTDESGRVVGLSLARNGLSGAIPVELGELSALTDLYLGRNQFEGAIPAEIGQLSKLRHLDLSHNELTGPIPAEIGELSVLTYLGLGYNRLSNGIPGEIGRLSELRVLDLRRNRLSGPIPPVIGDVDGLEALYVGENYLSGEIPGELGRLAALRTLEAGGNGLSGSIPPELGRLDRLKGLYLGSNQLSGEIPKEIGRLARLNGLSLGNNQLSGPIPAGLGDLANLAQLDLGDNDLTGRLPPELGRATRLEHLDLRFNALNGPVPPEFGNLTLMRSLILANNADLAGPLPPGMTALERLERFMAGGTGLCRPADRGFDAWFGTISERRLARCAGGTAVYLTQTIQSWDDPVPLLAGEQALLRVFVTAPEEATVTMPDVRATFYVDGTERHSVLIAGSTRSIPAEVMQGDLELSANAEIPDWVIVPGLEMVIEVDPESTLDAALGVTKRIPEEGRMAVDVQAVPPFQLTLVPLLFAPEPDSSVVESVLAMAEDPDGHELLADVRTLLPATDRAVVAHEPVAMSFRSPFPMHRLIQAVRTIEGGSGHWMGVFQPNYDPESFSYRPIAGVGSKPGWTSVSKRDPGTIAHELGHNLSLGHAPCGNPGSTDPWYPHSDGRIGVWGYDFGRSALVKPDIPDVMSYCDRFGYWISDFSFNKALKHRLANGGAQPPQ